MTRRGSGAVPPCDRARTRMHAVLDAGLLDASERQRLDEHLTDCASCRERWDELQRLQERLRELPTAPLADDALAEVFARTRGMRPARPGRAAGLGWRAAAAAAVLILAAWGAWSLRPVPVGPPAGPALALVDEATREFTAEERDQAIREARLALQLAASALDRAQQVGVRRVEEVLSEDVSPALEKVPVKLPGRPGAGRSQT